MVVVVAIYAGLVALGMSLALVWGLKYAALVLGVSCYLSFGWASRRFFRRTGPLNSCQRLVLASMYATGALHVATILYKNHGTIWHFIAALFLFQFSQVLFWSSVVAARRHALSLFFAGADQPSGLLTSGPYNWVRHPFYTSYTVAWLAGAVATDQVWLLGSVAVCLVIYYRAAASEERAFLESGLLADSYLAYSRRAGMFWPSPVRVLTARPVVAGPALAASAWRPSMPAFRRDRPATAVRPATAPVGVAANFGE